MRWLAVLLFATAGLAASIWQIRAASSLSPIAALGGGWAAAQLFDTLTRRKVNFASIYALSFSLLFSFMIWSFLTKSLFRQAPSAVHETGEYTKATQSIAAGQTCFRSEIYTALSALPAGLVLAPIDSGAHILAHGPHRVLAAAYHRNNAGNHQAIKILLGDPQQARHSIISAGVDYIALCNGGSEMRLLQLRAPNGFAAQLQRGKVPDWLERISAPDQRLLIFKIINR